jgi:hypothetical protein
VSARFEDDPDRPPGTERHWRSRLLFTLIFARLAT